MICGIIAVKVPVALSGQMHTRIAKQVESPVTSTALTLESRDRDKLLDQAIMVSCDLVEIREGILEMLRAKYGKDLLVLGWTGAGGDQSPYLMYRKAAEKGMRQLCGLDRLEDIAQRVVAAWEVAYVGASQERHRGVTMVHKFQNIELPERVVTELWKNEASK